MTRAALYNVLGLAFTLAVAMLSVSRDPAPPLDAPAAAPATSAPVTRLPDGTPALVDHGGHATPLRRYERIVSGSTVADQLLIELCERDRIVAFTAYGASHHEHPAYAGKATHPGIANLELMIGLRPDLVITNHVGDPKVLSRLREQHFEVFDLGELRGMSTLVPNILAVGELIGRPEAARAYAERLRRRMSRLAEGIPASARRASLYVTLYGTQMSGGGRGTSYHDVIAAAGLEDVAAPLYTDWPEYTSETLLTLDPETITTLEGTGDRICSHPGLERLRACRDPGRIFELPGDLIGDPGPRMLEAAERLHDVAYPAPAATSTRSSSSLSAGP